MLCTRLSFVSAIFLKQVDIAQQLLTLSVLCLAADTLHDDLMANHSLSAWTQ